MIIEIKVPVVGETINEVTLAKWLKKDGDLVHRDEILCEFESEKATFELSAEQAGKLSVVATDKAVLKIGEVVARIDTSILPEEKKEESKRVDTKTEIPKTETTQPIPVLSVEKTETIVEKNYATGTPSPAAAKMIRESGVEINSGSGKSGRITKADILAAIKNPKHKPETQLETQNPKLETGFTKLGTRLERREQMSSLRKAVSKHLVTAKNQTAMLTTFNEVDMKPIMDIRNQFKDAFKEKHGVNLGFMSFFAKAVCNALQEFPAVNASLDGDEIIYHDYCDISIAVSTPKGLVVPVIRNAESLSMVEIEMKVAELAKKGRDNKLSLEEMTGGTFTISNGGVFGSLMSTPIINIPQVAILGMHKIQERPIALNGQVVIRPMMYLALSYDHRMIDGKESVTFLVRIKEQLENPSHLLFGQDPMKYLLDL